MPCSREILVRTSRVGSSPGSDFIIHLRQQLERCYEQGHVQPEQGVHAPDVAERVRVREMLTVPGYQKVAAVKGGEREMERVTCRVAAAAPAVVPSAVVGGGS